MKLTVLGGGGVRAPLLAKSICSRAVELGITQVVFMDNNEEKLAMFGGLAREVARADAPSVAFELTSDPILALRDTDAVIATLRVGDAQGRVLDETVPLSMGLLGQETTGAGGFAMAMRSIPALLDYCELIKDIAKPGVRVFNFTNPSGLVTQTLHDAGYGFVIGICDGPSEFIKELERLTDTPAGGLCVECCGLNHFSWYPSVCRDGVELLPDLLWDEKLFQDTEMRLFDPELTRSLGALCNGYLYYYYHREQALHNIKKEGITRGRVILDINRRMEEELHGVDIQKDFKKAMQIYLEYYCERENSYMTIESASARGNCEQVGAITDYREIDNNGYAGVALNILSALRGGEGRRMVLSVPNCGVIAGLKDTDIIETSCMVNQNGITPVRMGVMPEFQLIQMQQMKLYERLASAAIREHSIEKACMALTIHPLVSSYSLSKRLMKEFLSAHKAYVGTWS